MPNHTDLRRRWIGAIFLGLSALLLLLGETVLREPLHKGHWLTLGYWAACFLFVILAVLVALLDMTIMRKRLQAEQRELVDETVQKILRDSKPAKGGSHSKNQPEGPAASGS